jgi:23S rRNA (pseudouridine1915-N3)-methyltransferase
LRRLTEFRILAVGKDKTDWLTRGCAHYEKLLKRWARVSWTYLPGARDAASLSPAEIKKTEAAAILRKLDRAFVVALADRGETMASETVAARLEQWQVRGGGRIDFVVGGAYGLDEAVYRRADFVWSLSPLTFSHQIVRLVLLEQLYRALSILHHHGYHK